MDHAAHRDNGHVPGRQTTAHDIENAESALMCDSATPLFSVGGKNWK